MGTTIAFAVNNNNEFEKKHFGDADKYILYQFENKQFRFSEELINPTKDIDESNEHGSREKGQSIIAALKEKNVKVLVSKQFGKNINMVNKHFVPVIIDVISIDEACIILSQNSEFIDKEQLQFDADEYSLHDLR